MLVNVVRFSPIQQGQDDEFRAWFVRSNEDYAPFEAFVGRRLLELCQGGNYVAIVEHESFETFMAMHTSPVQAESRHEVGLLLDGDPTPSFYEVVIG